jgi:hypothetical protein
LTTSTIQSAKLIPSLFDHIDEDRRITVLDVGPAGPDTVNFFSQYRCKLHFIDLFAELPFIFDPEVGPSLQQQFGEALQFPAGTQFDICLFWDLFNYLDRDAAVALQTALRPYLHGGSLAHGFSVHNPRTPRNDQVYGLRQRDELSLKPRPSRLPGYAPHNQKKLQEMLSDFSFERSVLLSDGRLELFLRARQ